MFRAISVASVASHLFLNPRKGEIMFRAISAVVVVSMLLVVTPGVQADVVPGNLVTNGDFNTDLSGWSLNNAVHSTILPTWTNTAADGGGMLFTGDTAMLAYQGLPSSIGTSTDPLVLTFDVGSPDASLITGQFNAELYRSNGGKWPLVSGIEPATISGYQLNDGVQSYTIHYPSSNIVLGDQYELDFETYNVNSSSHVVLDNVALVQSPVPEPSTLVLVVSALLGLLAYAWRKRK